MNRILESQLYEKITEESNIYAAIYSVRSYVFEPGLLSEEDHAKLIQLYDVYDEAVIRPIISECRIKLETIFRDPAELFECKVFFKIKSGGEEGTEYRQIHSSDLISLICMVCMLNVIMFEDTESGRKLSNVSNLLPANFYGHIPSAKISEIFVPWFKKYKQYSQNVISAYDTYKRSMKYKYEVVLDIKQFFPSVPPKYIYFILTEKLKVFYQKETEFECLKQLIFKLLYFRISNIDDCYEFYYRNKEMSISHDLLYNEGLPQGLPQSYFFGNLCMMEMAKIYEKYFPGDSYFYVDDSVIYTNLTEIEAHGHDQIRLIFEECIEKIENDFHELINKSIETISSDLEGYYSVLTGLCEFEDSVNYRITLHRKGKSSCALIESMRADGRNFLRRISLEASVAGNDIYRSMNILDENAIYRKYKALSDGLETELRMVKAEMKKLFIEDKFNLEQYKKQLIRYSKFFKYRYKRLKRELDENIDLDSILEFKEKYRQNKASAGWFVDDIFTVEADMLIKSLPLSEKDSVIRYVCEIEKLLCENDTITHNLYFAEILGRTKQYAPIDRYKTLKEFSDNNLRFLRSSCETVVIKRMEQAIQSKLDFFQVPQYASFVQKLSPTFDRCILNMYLSAILDVSLSDEIIIYKKNNRILTYYEYRILSYVRNKNYQPEKYGHYLREIIANTNKGHDYEKLDISLYGVIDHFVRYVKQPKLIDDLIVTHRYIAGIWRNGSQFLYFYTLHNQEHSAELIRNCVSITHNMGYWELKHRDYYLLFLASYLHDISMTEYPNLDTFLLHEQKSDIIFTEWKNELQKEIDNSSVHSIRPERGKRIIRSYFEKVNRHFEHGIRSRHSKASARMIRTLKELKFLTNEEREITAQISEAHGYDAMDVYKTKSKAGDQLISLKYLKIILRLADLMDMSKDRVSLDILRKNIKNMPEESKFHWISHSAINSCVVNTEYTFEKKLRKGAKTYLVKENFCENIGIEIRLNTKYLTTVSGAKCKFFQGEFIASSEGSDQIRITASGKACKNCIFSCRWMMAKNSLLFKEIKELENYLKDLDINNFKTAIHVGLIFENDRALDSEYSDIVKQKIEQNSLSGYL